MEALYTKKGSKIDYSKYGVGKKVGSKIYVHIDYILYILNGNQKRSFVTALKMLETKHHEELLNGASWSIHCVCYDYSNPNVIRFDTCPNFDTEDCPVVGDMYYVDVRNKTIVKRRCNQIFHHKWLWVRDNYKGFDVQKSYEYSKTWLEKFEETASGSLVKWQEQLKKYCPELLEKGGM